MIHKVIYFKVLLMLLNSCYGHNNSTSSNLEERCSKFAGEKRGLELSKRIMDYEYKLKLSYASTEQSQLSRNYTDLMRYKETCRNMEVYLKHATTFVQNVKDCSEQADFKLLEKLLRLTNRLSVYTCGGHTAFKAVTAEAYCFEELVDKLSNCTGQVIGLVENPYKFWKIGKLPNITTNENCYAAHKARACFEAETIRQCAGIDLFPVSKEIFDIVWTEVCPTALISGASFNRVIYILVLLMLTCSMLFWKRLF